MKPDEICIIRARFELTQAEMAALVGVDARTVRKWESGECRIPISVQRLLRLAMRVPGAYRALQAMVQDRNTRERRGVA